MLSSLVATIAAPAAVAPRRPAPCRMMREASPDGKTLITLDGDFVYTVHPEGDPIACEKNAARANRTNARGREGLPRASHGDLRSSGRRGDRIGRRHRPV